MDETAAILGRGRMHARPLVALYPGVADEAAEPMTSIEQAFLHMVITPLQVGCLNRAVIKEPRRRLR
jgi:hypothetical protein